MIPQLEEHFGAEAQYATLHEATVTLVDMGERTVSTQVRIDGDHAPTFDGWYVIFKGEKFVLPIKEPQATKDNSTRNSLIDLTFRSWVVDELKRYFYFQSAAIDANTAIADKYQASVRMSLPAFVSNFNSVLQHYWPDSGEEPTIRMFLDPAYQNDTTSYLVEIDNAKIWDVLTKMYEIFGVRWDIAVEEGVYRINVGFEPAEIGADDHTFQYGYEGGLLRFERQVQDEDIINILLGRGGEKNLPYRYFKRSMGIGGEVPASSQSVADNLYWAGDPDAIPELENIYFDRLRDLAFRWYVRGWMQNSHHSRAWGARYNFPTYTEASIPTSTTDSELHGRLLYAFRRGKTDAKFDPVEFVSDKLECSASGEQSATGSIAKYGERWGALDNNDDIYPTIQNRYNSFNIGRIDEIVDVSAPTDDDPRQAAQEAAIEQTLADISVSCYGNYNTEFDIYGPTFTVPEGKTGNITYTPFAKETTFPGLVDIDTGEDGTYLVAISGGNEYGTAGLSPGTYQLKLHLVITRDPSVSHITGTFGIQNVVLTLGTAGGGDAWLPTFDIWVKNIWGTMQMVGESDQQYAERVWLPILGDRSSNEAKIVFTSGLLAFASDYEFTIIGIPVFDESKTVITTNASGQPITVPSHWRITLQKSDAEMDATGKFIPNSQAFAVARDTFFFTGIDMPFYFVNLAEQELDIYKAAQLSQVKEIAPTWVINLDKVRVHTEEEADTAGLIADRLKTGMLLHIADPRFAADGLALYVQTLTYKWAEPTPDNPYIVPDIEVVLSDKIVPAIGTVAKIQGEISVIQSEYVRATDVEEIVRRVASAIFLKKTGESDTSASPTAFSSKVTSDDFSQGGVAGQGWGVYRSNAPMAATGDAEQKPDSVIEADRVIVRKELEVNTLVVNQIEARGGKEIMSAAKIEVTNVAQITETVDGESIPCYRCYFDQKQGSIDNLFVVGDIARCQKYAADWDSTPTKYYQMIVVAKDIDHISLRIDSNDGQGTPEKGDVIVQYGNIDTVERQFVIVRDVIGGGYEQMVSGLTASYNAGTGKWVYASGKEYFFAGRYASETTPRFFIGDAQSNQYIEYANNRLTIKGGVDISNMAGSTTIEGNLVQTGEIMLGSVSGAAFNVYAGISGNYSGRIAAWYGGPKVDHEKTPSTSPYAKSLFRFDGSGYLSSGKIHWDEYGAGGIPGITWNGSGTEIIIGSEVKFVSGQATVGLVDAVKQLNDMFERYALGNDRYAVRVKSGYAGFFADGFVSGGGPNTSGGSAGALYSLDDVLSSGEKVARYGGSSQAQMGDLLGFNGTHWYAIQLGTNLSLSNGVLNAAGGGGSGTVTSVTINQGSGISVSSAGTATAPAFTISLSSTYAGGTKVTLNGTDKGGNTASFYAPTGASNAEGAYVAWPASGSAPEWRAPGSVASNGTNLVTGKTVYDYLNDGTSGYVTLNTDQEISGTKTFGDTAFRASILRNSGGSTRIELPASGDYGIRVSGNALFNNAIYFDYATGKGVYGKDGNSSYELLYINSSANIQIGGYNFANAAHDILLYGKEVNITVRENTTSSVLIAKRSDVSFSVPIIPQNAGIDIGAAASGSIWRRLYAERLYPTANSDYYIDFNQPSGGTPYFRIHGAGLAVDSFVAAGGTVSASSEITVNASLIPTQDNTYSLGDVNYYFKDLYVTTIGAAGEAVARIYVDNIGSSAYKVSSIYAENIVCDDITVTGEQVTWDWLASYTPTAGGINITDAAHKSAVFAALDKMVSGKVKTIVVNASNYSVRYHIVSANVSDDTEYNIYFGNGLRLWAEENASQTAVMNLEYYNVW